MVKRKYTLKQDFFDERDYKFGESFRINKKLPKSVDLRNKVIRVFDQGDKNSCTSNAGCANREFLLQDKSKFLSREFLYNIERIMEGDVNLENDEGCQMRTIAKALSKYGISEESYLPYTDENLHTKPSDEAMKNAEQYKINSYHRVLTLNEIKFALSQDYPVLMGMKVYTEMESDEMAQTGELKLPNKESEYLGNHAILIVGFGDNTTQKFSLIRNIINKITGKSQSKGNLIILNSWGEDWGKGGYFFMPYEYLKYTIDKWVITK